MVVVTPGMGTPVAVTSAATRSGRLPAPPARHHRLDGPADRSQELLLGQLDAELAEHGDLGHPPHRLGVDEQPVHVEDDRLDGGSSQAVTGDEARIF